MKKAELYYKMVEKGIALDGFEELSGSEYFTAQETGDNDVYKHEVKDGVCIFRTKGASDTTTLELLFRSYLCLKTIKNILLFTFITAIIASVILLVTTLI